MCQTGDTRVLAMRYGGSSEDYESYKYLENAAMSENSSVRTEVEACDNFNEDILFLDAYTEPQG